MENMDRKAEGIVKYYGHFTQVMRFSHRNIWLHYGICNSKPVVYILVTIYRSYERYATCT